jgi:NADH-quinone oxidoreductase subunit E
MKGEGLERPAARLVRVSDPVPLDAAPPPAPAGPPLEFSAAARERIAWLYTRYPVREAALLPILRVAEEEFGGIGPEALECVAREVGLPSASVFGVFTFYTHFRRKGEGRYLLQVCATLPCALRGCRTVLHWLEEKLGIRAGETTPDGRFTLKKVECLASCDTAPVVQINDDYHENLTLEALEGILEGLP